MTTCPYTLDETRPIQIGLIVLQADERIEQDMRQLLPAEVEILVSRVPSGAHVTRDSLAEMDRYLTGAASLFPASAQVSAVGYGCTSGTAEIGAARVAAAIRAGVATPHVTDPVTALIAACRARGLRSLAILSPYIASVSAQLNAVLAEAGITVTAFASFGQSEEGRVARITPASIAAAAIDLGQGAQADALFISCTNLQTLGIMAEVETRIGKPVLSSNQVLAEDLIRRLDQR